MGGCWEDLQSARLRIYHPMGRGLVFIHFPRQLVSTALSSTDVVLFSILTEQHSWTQCSKAYGQKQDNKNYVRELRYGQYSSKERTFMPVETLKKCVMLIVRTTYKFLSTIPVELLLPILWVCSFEYISITTAQFSFLNHRHYSIFRLI